MITTRASSVRKFLPLGPEGWLIRTPGYTAREVRELLRDRGRTERGRAVSRCVARPSDWLPAPDVERCPPYYHERLPRIVFWYAQGESVEAISMRVCAFGTPWGVERSLNTACQHIADRLNQSPRDYGA